MKKKITFICKKDWQPMVLKVDGKYSPYYKCIACSNGLSLYCVEKIENYLEKIEKSGGTVDKRIRLSFHYKRKKNIEIEFKDDNIIVLVE